MDQAQNALLPKRNLVIFVGLTLKVVRLYLNVCFIILFDNLNFLVMKEIISANVQLVCYLLVFGRHAFYVRHYYGIQLLVKSFFFEQKLLFTTPRVIGSNCN